MIDQKELSKLVAMTKDFKEITHTSICECCMYGARVFTDMCKCTRHNTMEIDKSSCTEVRIVYDKIRDGSILCRMCDHNTFVKNEDYDIEYPQCTKGYNPDGKLCSSFELIHKIMEPEEV